MSTNGTAQPTLTEQHEEAVKVYLTGFSVVEEARGQGKDTKTLNKLSGALGGPFQRIRNLELQMAIEEIPFTPFEKPKVARSSSLGLTEDEYKANLAKVSPLLKDKRETVRKSAESRVTAIKKQAAKHGFKL